MTEEPYQIRKTVVETRNQAEARPRPPAGAPPSLNRRHLLFGATVTVAATAAGAAWWLGSSGLPEPAGQAVGPEYLAATLKVKPAPRLPMPPDHATWSTCVAASPMKGLADLDLVLAIDTTASMGGVINDVKANVAQLIAALRAGGGSVRVGIVAYRDTRDDYVVRSFSLTTLDAAGTAALNGFIAGLRATGGGDWPEKLDAALDVATAMTWRGDVASSIVVLADAPAHPQDQATALATAEAFTTKIPGAQVSLIDTGSGGHAFMQALPRRGGGQYVTYDGHLLNSLFPAITGCPSH
ncbi:MAG: vWA domain-containing protein [Xanthobacteraceae bacterium]